MKWPFGAKRTRSKPDLDQETLRQLKKAGANLALPTEVQNYLYFPTEELARQAASQLLPEGYQVEVRAPIEYKPGVFTMWLALAVTQLVPTTDNIALLRQRMEMVANSLGGDFDGWEAAVAR